MVNERYEVCFESVSCLFPGSVNKTLKDLSFKLKPGSINAILGGGGSGKTTICNLISGIIPKIQTAKVTGNIYLKGKNINNYTLPDLSILVGKVAQEPDSMFCNLHVKDEVAFGLENLCIEPKIIMGKVKHILEQVGLSGLEDKQITKLSGGQIQRLALACILIMETEIIILDEPTANLDPMGVRELFNLLYEFKKSGKTIIITSKEWYEEISSCDNILILHSETIKINGSPSSVLNTYREYLLDLSFYIPQISEFFLKQNRLKGTIPSTIEEAKNLINKSSFVIKTTYKSRLFNEVQYHTLYQFENLSFIYSDGTKALKDITFRIKSNSLVALVGQNGAGKSTLAKLMVGLLKPATGKILFKGKPVSIKEINSKVGFVFQNPEHQFITDSVYDELAYTLRIRKIDEGKIEEKVETALEIFRLKSEKTKHPLLLNAGQKRRLAVASILISEPEVIIIDEPTYGQDKHMTKVLMEIITSLAQKGISIIMITHDMRLVHEYAEHVYVMSHGNLIFAGKPSELFIQRKILERAGLFPPQIYRIVDLVIDKGRPRKSIPRTVDELIEMLA